MLMRGRAANRVIWPIVLPSLLIAALVIMRQPHVVDTSDSTAQQSLLRSWLDVGHVRAYLPPDTWVLKIPFYLAVEVLPIGPHGKLLADALILNVLTFVLLGWAVWVLARAQRPRWYEITVPLLWLASLGGGIGSNRMLLNYRNIELGLCFVALALGAQYLTKNKVTGGRRAARLLVAGAALSVFWLDDPYFALLVGVPFIGACLVWFCVREADVRFLELATCVAASLLVMPGWHRLAAAGGFQIGGSTGDVSLSPAQWVHDLRYLGPGIEVQIGIDHGSGALYETMRLLIIAALGLAVLAGVGLAWHGWRNRRFLVTFVGLHWPLVVAGYLASSHAAEHGSSRYLILAGYDLAVATAVALPLVRRRVPAAALVMVAVLAAGALLNTVATARTVGGPTPALTVARQQQLDAVRSTGLAKGYGQFWSGNVTIYLTGGAVTMNPVRCQNGRFIYDSWLTDTARYRVKAEATFLIWEPAVPYFQGCPRSEVDRLLGPPARTIDSGNGTSVLVYDKDIGPALTDNPLPHD